MDNQNPQPTDNKEIEHDDNLVSWILIGLIALFVPLIVSSYSTLPPPQAPQMVSPPVPVMKAELETSASDLINQTKLLIK